MAAVTWNPADKGANIVLSSGNLAATGGGATYNSVRATSSLSAGKLYWEHKFTALTVTAVAAGFGTSGMSLTTYPGNSATSCSAWSDGSTFVNGITNVNALGVTFAVNDFMNVAIDYDAGKIWIGKNGTYVASGNPAAGTNPWCTFTANTALFPAWAAKDASNASTANFGATAFNNAQPTGFTAFQATAYTLTPATGAYALAGVAVVFNRAARLVAATGAYALTGVAVVFNRGLHLIPATGAYVLTGVAATLRKAWKPLAAATGSYTLTGVALIEAFIPGPPAFKRRVAAILQQLRVNPPSLDQ